MALSMPPFGLFPLLWICLPALIALLQGTKNNKQAFFTGWSFAFGFFVFGLYWISVAMFVDLRHFWWAVPFAIAGLPAILAIYYGLVGIVARKLDLSDLPGVVLFGLFWFLAEYARGHILTGFPWNLLGYAWSDVLPILQFTSVAGIYGLTLVTTVIACLPASLENKSAKAYAAFLASLFFLVILGSWGEIRLKTTALEPALGVHARLVQPNIAQVHKWKPMEQEKNFQDILELSTAPASKRITHIFWPETASTFYLSEDSAHRKEIASKIPSAVSVITGVLRRDVSPNGKMRYFNSLVVLDGMGRLVGGYDKSHLVPFGEYMPFRDILPLKALAASNADFTPGDGPRSLRVLGLPLFSPLICYEAIFSGAVTDSTDRPDFLVNLTNDAWYGRTTGPYQHFAIAKVRAVEEGMMMLRIANTGISGVIDPMGRVEKKLGLGEKGVIDTGLLKALPFTIFSQWGERIVWFAFFVLFAANAQEAKKLRKKEDI